MSEKCMKMKMKNAHDVMKNVSKASPAIYNPKGLNLLSYNTEKVSVEMI